MESPPQPSLQQAQGSYIAQAEQGSVATVNVYAAGPPSVDKNRQRMLERVHTIWIQGVLQQSLHGAALLALGLHMQSDVIENPWRLLMQEVDQPARPLPLGTPIIQAFDEADGALLILGEPGAGKTTLLLELARALLERASRDKTYPMPIVFNLSSWAEKRLPLTEWLIVELDTKYQIRRELGKSWIDTDQVLLLLDGLDEVVKEYRAACIDAINIYRHEHGLVPIVVCSRSAEYLAQTKQLLLQSAVVIQPLTEEQIEHYMQSAGGQLEALQHALRNDPELYELVHQPLMLSIFTLAYQGAVVEDLPRGGTREAQQRQVFAAYIERMLLHRGAQSRYSQEHVQHWLAWLARQMQQHYMTEFYLEALQPTWLPTKSLQQICTLLIWLALGFSGLAFGLIFVALQPHMFWRRGEQERWDSLVLRLLHIRLEICSDVL